MLFILQHNQKPAWLSWLNKNDTLLLRHDAVYLQRWMSSNSAAKILVCAQDCLVRGLEAAEGCTLIDSKALNELIGRSTISLCQS